LASTLEELQAKFVSNNHLMDTFVSYPSDHKYPSCQGEHGELPNVNDLSKPHLLDKQFKSH
jgi:hypothetical protein